MKTLKHFILALICITLSIPSWAYDFTSVNGENTFFFTITSNTSPYTVEVTSQNQTEPYYTDTATLPRGYLNIPSTVTYNGNTYTVTAIGDNAFRYCDKIASLTIPNTITTIGMYAFSECFDLGSVSIPNSVTKIKEGAFLDLWGLTVLTLPNNIDSISYLCFAGISVASLTIPNSVKYIGVEAFEGLFDVTYLNIPNSVIYIDSFAFDYCPSLTSVTLGTSVKFIGKYAFAYNDELYQFTCKSATPPDIDAEAFSEDDALATLFVPCNTKTAYQAANTWKDFTNIREKFTYTITATPNNTAWGTVSYTSLDCSNLTTTMTAIPKTGYMFVQWTDGNTENPRLVTVNQDTTFKADFALDDAIEETENFKHLSVFPNPTTNQFTIDYGQNVINEVRVYDIVGKELLHVTINDSKATINTESWKNSIYFVKIVTENGTITKQLRKE